MKIYIPGKSVVQVFPGGGNFIPIPGKEIIGINKPGIRWLLRDEFYTDLAAGSVNGTAAEPGPGTRAIRDVESKTALSGGWAEFTEQVTPALAEQDLLYPVRTRTPGRIGLCKFRISTSVSSRPLMWVVSGTPAYNGDLANSYYTTNAPAFGIVNNGITGPLVSNIVANGTIYKLAIILRATGAFYYIKGGIYTNWTLLFIDGTGTGANQYLGSAGYNSIFSTGAYRIPTTLWLPTPLLSTSGAMTWPLTNGLGHAEGVAGGLGSGGANLTMLDAGTWAADGTYITNTPVAGVEKVSDPGFDDSGQWGTVAGWVVGSNVMTATAVSMPIQNNGAASIAIGLWYKAQIDVSSIAGSLRLRIGSVSDGNILPSIDSTGNNIVRTARTIIGGKPALSATGLTGVFDNASFKPLPISSLITNVQLTTTDVLCEAVIHAYTLGTQAGLVQSDRSFAAKAAATAAAGQAVISLKEVTGVGGVGLAITDSITIAGVTYTIASVAGGANVAYNDTAKTQTVTLGANLGAEVLADAKVGLDWAAWNGTLHYLDGAGNLKVDEILAGVYTNRGSTATTFSADKRLIVRKIGSEYRIFYNEALVGSAISTVAAGAMVGKYWGLFSTLPANTITSMVVHDTGNVTAVHNTELDKYSRD